MPIIIQKYIIPPAEFNKFSIFATNMDKRSLNTSLANYVNSSSEVMQAIFQKKFKEAISDGEKYSVISKRYALQVIETLKNLFGKADIHSEEFGFLDFSWNFGKNGMLMTFSDIATIAYSGNIVNEDFTGYIKLVEFNFESKLYEFIERLCSHS